MSWIYNSANGNLSRNGQLVGTGYSGHGDGLDNPAYDGVHNVGPIPTGDWTIGDFFDDPEGKGPVVAHLNPSPLTDTHNRSGFMIHGDNPAMNHSASDGCLIFNRDIRQQIAESGDTDLVVA